MQADDGTGSSQQVTIPVEADFLYVYSTADGLYLSWLCTHIENAVNKYIIYIYTWRH